MVMLSMNLAYMASFCWPDDAEDVGVPGPLEGAEELGEATELDVGV